MKIAIIGSRSYTDQLELNGIVDYLTLGMEVDTIVSGGAKGADTLAESYAILKNLVMEIYPPDYDKHGRAAPFVRNRQIVDAADYVIAFWDGSSTGTKNSLDYAQKTGTRYTIFRTKERIVDPNKPDLGEFFLP